MQEWIDRLHQECITQSNSPIEIISSFRFLAVDILSHLVIGKPFGSVKVNKDVHDFLSTCLAGTQVQMSLSVLPWLKNVLILLSYTPVLGKYLTSAPGYGTPLGKILVVR